MVARLYSFANPSPGRFRKHSIYAFSRRDRGGRRGRRFNGIYCGRGRGGRVGIGRRGHTRGGREWGSGVHENGIDISDVTRYFEDSEWAAFSNDTRKRIIEDPVRTKFLENKKRRTTSSVSAEKDNENRLISQIITGVQNASINKSGLEGGVNRFPNNVSRAQVSAANIGSIS